jgi:hypothetical protein
MLKKREKGEKRQKVVISIHHALNISFSSLSLAFVADKTWHHQQMTLYFSASFFFLSFIGIFSAGPALQQKETYLVKRALLANRRGGKAEMLLLPSDNSDSLGSLGTCPQAGR